MKRSAILAIYFLWGLFNTWLSLYLVSRLNFSFLPPFIASSGACGDYGQCEVSIWAHLAFFGILLFPTTVHVAVGFFQGKPPTQTIKRHAYFAVALAIGTFLFYAGARALHGV